jgi:dipeptidyl aminopeptidase/acylaminoacyl peptidase
VAVILRPTTRPVVKWWRRSKLRFLYSTIILQLSVTLCNSASANIGTDPAHPMTLDEFKDLVSHGTPYSFYSALNWIPGTHRLVYSLGKPGQRKWIYLMSVPSGERRALTEGDNPSPSPDATWLAFVREPTASSGRTELEKHVETNSSREMWISRIDGSEARRIGNGICGEPAWSPDSLKVAYFVCNSYASGGSAGRLTNTAVLGTVDAISMYPLPALLVAANLLHVVDVDTGRDRVILDVHQNVGHAPLWLSRDTLLYEHDDGKSLGDSTWTISTLDVSSTGSGITHEVVAGYVKEGDYLPAWNPRTGELAINGDPTRQNATYYPYLHDIGLVSLASSAVRWLPFPGDADAHRMTWTPDGKWLLFSGGTSTQHELLATDGVDLKALTVGDGVHVMPVLSSDGRYIAWWRIDPCTDAASVLIGEWRDGRMVRPRELISSQSPLEGIARGRCSAVRWRTRDGNQMDGFLILPTPEPRGKSPLVVMIHGGPTGGASVEGEFPGGIYFGAYLSERGYALFIPDYRASGLHGFNLVLAARASRDMFRENWNDISAGIDALIDRKVADPKRLYLLGHSFGSFQTNWILTHDSRFRAAVSYEGGDFLYDWARADSGTNEQFEWWLDATTPMTESTVWAENSAVLNVSNARTPTLFVNGELGLDLQSMPWLAAAMRKQGVDTQYVLYRGEGHGVVRTDNQRDLLERIGNWLSAH